MNIVFGILEIIFRVQGKGTEILSRKKEEDLVDIIGPLGYGTFKFEGYKNIAVLGGGIGVFPLYELAKNASKSATVNTYLGFRNKEAVVVEEEFEKVSNKLVITTDDGSYKEKGFAIDFMKKDIEEHKVDMIFACGPHPMLKAVRQYAIENNIPCQISLEERMACGVGACLGCVCKTTKKDHHSHVNNARICTDGPVFLAEDVDI